LSEPFITAIIEFSAVLVGILVAFWINRVWERRKFEKRLEEILPTIFFEITDNRRLLEDLFNNPNRFYSDMIRFDTSNWTINSEDISRIEPTLLIHLTNIYHNLKHLNHLFENYPNHNLIPVIADKTRIYVDEILKRLENLLTAKYRQGYERIKQERQKREL
jgi:hypothetical protein